MEEDAWNRTLFSATRIRALKEIQNANNKNISETMSSRLRSMCFSSTLLRKIPLTLKSPLAFFGT